MSHRVCPWWVGYILASPIRSWMGQDAAQIVGPFIKPGMVVLEPGPGMGFFTLEMARRLGNSGRVVAVDIQPRMLKSLTRRAAQRGLAARIETRLATPDSLNVGDLTGNVDFVLAFAVVHEMPSAAHFFQQAAKTMKPGARLLFAEPRGHIKPEQWNEELRLASEAGLERIENLEIPRSNSVILQKA